MPRPRLVRAIQQALVNGPVIILAPPGYGKSVILRELVIHQPGALLLSLHPEALELHPLHTRIAACAPDALLILDDIHHLEQSAEIVDWLHATLCQSRHQWLLAGRRVPSQLIQGIPSPTQLGPNELALTPAESSHLFQLYAHNQGKAQTKDSASPLLSLETRRAWYQYTAGWPLGLSLAVQSGKSARPPAGTTGHSSSLGESAKLDVSTLLAQLLAEFPVEMAEYVLVSALPLRISHHLLGALLDLPLTQSARRLAELTRRNFFLQADEEPGWYRYHDLIREQLQLLAHNRLGETTVNALLQRAAEWFARQRNLPQAVEHALLGKDGTQAAAFMQQLPSTYIWDFGIFRTYQRWIEALDATLQVRNINLLIQLGRGRLDIGDRSGARIWLNRALAYAEARPAPELIWEARTALAKLHNMEGELDQALALCRSVIDQSPPTHPAHLQALNALGNAYTQLNRTAAARACFERALEVASTRAQAQTTQADWDTHTRFVAGLHHNLAMGIYIPMGDFPRALVHLQVNDRYYATRPVARSLHLLAWCAYYEALGEWEKLGEALHEIEVAESQSEHPDEENIWYFWNKALYHTGKGEYAIAQTILDELQPMMISNEDILCLIYAQAWLLRRSGKFAAAIRVSRETLATPRDAPLYRGMLALEQWQSILIQHRHRLAAMYAIGTPSVSPIPQPAVMPTEVRELIRARAIPWLLRLHACLAAYAPGEDLYRLTALTTDDEAPLGSRAEAMRTESMHRPLPSIDASSALSAKRARRSRRRVLQLTEQKSYWRILIHREPELGLHFWSCCLARGQALPRASDALVALAAAENGLATEEVVTDLAPLLEHAFHEVRQTAAAVLARLGHEASLPFLGRRLAVETDAPVLAALEEAIDTLEAVPPPPLQICVLGEFKVLRGNVSLAAEDWQRPAVRRLFQYFVLHAGQPLSRDRILDDLWPEHDPGAARNTFRTLFSWLRRTLDPHLRPKATARYFQVNGEVYLFAPPAVSALVQSDMAGFESVITGALAQSGAGDLPPVSPEFLHALESWSPLLPELPYEPWAVNARERIDGLFVEGCLYAAQSLLTLQRAAEAARWARKVIEIAPWLEEAYQTLMRAQARQGQRSPALRTYMEAVDALQRELDVPPAALTEWLAQRLRQGEEI